jgi:hypothetical protein
MNAINWSNADGLFASLDGQAMTGAALRRALTKEVLYWAIVFRRIFQPAPGRNAKWKLHGNGL